MTVEKIYSPNIYRVITEWAKNHIVQRRLAYRVVTILSAIGICVIAFGTWEYIGSFKATQLERKTLEAKRTQWKAVVQKYPGYRDGFIHIAMLSYQLGDFKTAEEFTNKALSVDPNYMDALKLKGILITRR